MTRPSTLRLDGLEPDNLLAFLALLGLLRALERVRPQWRPRVAWTVDAPPVRPVLHVNDRPTPEMVLDAAVAGLDELAALHDFDGLKDLKLAPEIAAQRLRTAAAGDRYAADLWAALLSDAAVRTLSALTVVPRSSWTRSTRLEVLGGARERGHRGPRVFIWPIWRHPVSLATIRALLGHPRLREPAARDALGVVELRRARRISVGRYQNVTRADST